MTAPTRKRQKKTDSRVADLERKIDALTANLQHQHQQTATSNGREADESADHRIPPPSLAGSKRQCDGDVKGSAPALALPLAHTTPGGGADIVERGIVDMDTAGKAFHRYINDMAPSLPVVVFPSGMTVHHVRRTKPAVFHAITAAAIGPIQPSLQVGLYNDLYKRLAERIVVNGEKNLELVQALIVSYIWYDPPDRFEELKFYQLSHLAVILAMDVGMCRQTRKPASKQFNLFMGKKQNFDPDSPEARRTWLSCYFMSVL